MDILSCSNSWIACNASFLQSNLRNKRPKQRQSFYTFYSFLSILLLSILYIYILYISFYTCITTIKHAEDWGQLDLGNKSRHLRYFKLYVLSFKCTVLRFVVINEICHISRKMLDFAESAEARSEISSITGSHMHNCNWRNL